MVAGGIDPGFDFIRGQRGSRAQDCRSTLTRAKEIELLVIQTRVEVRVDDLVDEVVRSSGLIRVAGTIILLADFQCPAKAREILRILIGGHDSGRDTRHLGHPRCICAGPSVFDSVAINRQMAV